MKFVIRHVLLCGSLLLAIESAASADEENLSRLIKARTSAQLSQHLAVQHAVAHDSLVCDAELRTGKLPSACFRVLSIKEDAVEIAKETHSFDWLLQLCKDRAAKSKKWKELEIADRQNFLPEECRVIARERAADLRYADETEHPADLFDQLLQPDAVSPQRKARK